ncbi:MAG: Ig-like domain-containing protein [Thermoplasmata archaeon]|nr:MAG: Ig-like domain-containing protein [Thermoplasmata archaeon]
MHGTGVVTTQWIGGIGMTGVKRILFVICVAAFLSVSSFVAMVGLRAMADENVGGDILARWEDNWMEDDPAIPPWDELIQINFDSMNGNAYHLGDMDVNVWLTLENTDSTDNIFVGDATLVSYHPLFTPNMDEDDGHTIFPFGSETFQFTIDIGNSGDVNFLYEDALGILLENMEQPIGTSIADESFYFDIYVSSIFDPDNSPGETDMHEDLPDIDETDFHPDFEAGETWQDGEIQLTNHAPYSISDIEADLNLGGIPQDITFSDGINLSTNPGPISADGNLELNWNFDVSMDVPPDYYRPELNISYTRDDRAVTIVEYFRNTGLTVAPYTMATGPVGGPVNEADINISYNMSGTPPNVTIYYTLNTSAPYSWTLMDTDNTPDGIYPWTVPADGYYSWLAISENEEPPDPSTPPEASYYIFDSTPPNSFTPTADPSNWTSNTQPVIEFLTTDDLSGIDYYNISIDSGDFTTRMSPYTLPSQAEGTHNITVRAYDQAGNYRDEYVEVYIDITPPNAFIPIAAPSNWTTDTQPVISFSTTDETSSVEYYKVSIDHGSFYTQASPYTLPSQEDGIHNITVRAFDTAGNLIEGYVDVYIDTSAPIISHTPITTGATGIPINFTAVITDAHSGIDKAYLYCKKPTESTYTERQMYAIGNTYYVELPGTAVTTEGLEYYIKATDKTDPAITIYFGSFGGVEIEPTSTDDIDITITDDTTPPSITHNVVTSGTSGTPIAVTAGVTDDVSGVKNVFLYYKKPGESLYTEQQMTADGNTYSAEIPGSAATSAGLEYYLKASDKANNILYYGNSGQTGTEPTPLTDIDITIQDPDTTPPSITHSPVTSGSSGIPINITVDVTDESGVKNVFLYYKKPSQSTYTMQQMNPIGDTYYSEIPGTAVTTDGLEYYIKAEDGVDPSNIKYYGVSGQISTEPSGLNDIDITVTQDITSPTVIDKSPMGNNVAVNTTITISFDGPMNQASVQSAFSILPDVGGSSSWIGNQLVFRPNSDLDYSTTYNVTIGTGATDITGNPLESAISWEFTTVSDPSTVNVQILSTVPEDASTNVDVETRITIYFTEAMDKTSVDKAFSISPSIDGMFAKEGKSIIFIPDSNLQYGTKYVITIYSNATSEIGGRKLDKNYNIEFITEKAPEEKGLFSWETMEPIVTGLTVLASIIVFLIGFLTIRRKRGKLRRYMERVEDTFDEYKDDPKTCEEELIILRNDIKKDVHRGKIEENHFLILDKRIDDYLMELKTLEGKEEITTEGDITEPISEEQDVGEVKEDVSEEDTELL